MVSLKTDSILSAAASAERSAWLLRCLGPASSQRTWAIMANLPSSVFLRVKPKKVCKVMIFGDGVYVRLWQGPE